MFIKRIVPIGIIFLASIIGFWEYQNPCIESVDYTYQNGWQGENPFSIKVERIPESCSFAAAIAGANYIFSARHGNSESWQQIMTVHCDDPIDIPRNTIKIVSEKVAYTFMNGGYAVTSDSGKTWTVWDVDKMPNWNFVDYGYIKEVTVLENGIGSLKLNPSDKHKEVSEFYTSDFGKTWKQIK
ncbi:hypothetical protein BH18ACI1_BH18ACI1_14010 [soil metagenome]